MRLPLPERSEWNCYPKCRRSGRPKSRTSSPEPGSHHWRLRAVPKEVVDRINKIVNEYLDGPKGKELLRKIGMTAIGGTPAEAAEFIDNETNKWEKVLQSAGLIKDK